MIAAGLKKPTTAPVPPRAILDDRLTHLDLRVLVKICAHDRMSLSKGGRGCLVSTKAIALALCVHHTSVSTSTGRLTGWGYIVAQKRTDDGRGRTYRVIYTEEDDLAVRNSDSVIKPEDKSSLPLRETTGEKSFPQNDKVVSRDFENTDNFQSDGTYEYKEGNNSVETERNSDQSARLARGAKFESKTATAEMLRLLDCDIEGSTRGLTTDQLLDLSDWLEEAWEYYFDEDDTVSNWAKRLHEQINVIIDHHDETQTHQQKSAAR